MKNLRLKYKIKHQIIRNQEFKFNRKLHLNIKKKIIRKKVAPQKAGTILPTSTLIVSVNSVRSLDKDTDKYKSSRSNQPYAESSKVTSVRESSRVSSSAVTSSRYSSRANLRSRKNMKVCVDDTDVKRPYDYCDMPLANM